MRRTLFLSLLLLFALPASAADDARARVLAAAEAMGGEARLRALSSVRIQGIGHWNLLEQSERPAAPWLVTYEQVDELRVPASQRLRQKTEGRGAALTGPWKGVTLRMDGDVVAVEVDGKQRPTSGAQLQDLRERLDFSPERVLLIALEARDLRSAADTVLQDVPHHVVTFHHGRAAVRLFLNAHTALPTLVETEDALPADMFWSVWGDVRTRLFFQSWTLEPGGLRYPHHWEWHRNDTTYHSFTVTSVELEPKVSDVDFAIPEDVRKAFAPRSGRTGDDTPLGHPGRPAVELAPGVVHLPGRWDVALVKQDDGLVVIEAPMASGYSARVLEEASKRFPGVKVKAVVSTSDAWPHVGGLREYAARGIPIHLLDLNRPLVERLLKSPRTRVPDALARAPRAGKLQAVGRRTALGTGANRLELIPARTETGERMLFVWLPEHRLLYSSDLVQPGQGGGFFNPQQLTEAVDVAAREELDVARVFGMHLDSTEWKALTGAVEQARAPVTARATP